MKVTAILVFLTCQLASAQTNFFPVLSCSNRIYTNATIESVTPATVTIFWDGGGERIPITNLPAELLIRYHYDAQEAQKYLDKQAAKKAAKREQANEDAAALAAAQNTLGPPQKIRIIKRLLFPNSVQIEAEGKESKAYIPNLPPKILNFIYELDQAQADAAGPQAPQARAKGGHAKANSGASLPGYPNYSQLYTSTNAAPNGAHHGQDSAPDAASRLRSLQAKAEASTTIIARPTGIMISFDTRQWQYQSMAITNVAGKHDL